MTGAAAVPIAGRQRRDQTPDGERDLAGSERELRRRAGVVADELLAWPPEQVATRAVIEKLGAEGLIAARWDRPDDLGGIALVEELASRGLSSTAVVVSLHVDSVLAMLRQFARPELRNLVDAALTGTTVGCVAASEPGGGSDLNGAETTASATSDGWEIAGDKKFVTLGRQADFAIVLARLSDRPRPGGLGAFVVPRDGMEPVKTHRLVAGSDLETSWMRVHATVPSHHLLGRPGLGLAVVNWGLTKERLAVAALVVGACRLATTLAITHAYERRQFGSRLFDHQAIRFRLAELHTQLQMLSSELRYLGGQRAAASRRIAGLKVTAARFGERCLSECLQVFGGDGYVDDATPLGRLWRDIRLARIGGGTDEVMWEIVAGGLKADLDVYRKHVVTQTNGTHDQRRTGD